MSQVWLGQRIEMRKTIQKYEDLDVFNKAYQVSLQIHRFTLKMPRIEQRSLADQMLRASKSICANIAEGFGKQSFSKQEFRKYLAIAIGSADEMKVWIRYCVDLDYLDTRRADEWTAEYVVIAKMLSGLYKTWQ